MKTRKIVFLMVILLLSGGKLFSQNWQLVWSDEFTNGISGDWVFETGAGGWGNNELEYYRRENASVQNGQLVISAKRESYGGANYTSVRMKTQGKKSWTYGKIEARIAMPAFQGSWPAFWMLGDNISSVGWPGCGEIDIMEHVNTGGGINGTVHWKDANGNQADYGNATSVGSVADFHVYSIEWTSSYIRWFVDGNKYNEINIANNVGSTEEFQRSFFILLNLAVGGNWPGFSIDNNAFPANMYVDYVRVYQDNGVPQSTGVATFYKDCNFGGYAVGLPVGSYNITDLQARGISNDDISSLKINSGYEVQLFWDMNFTGSSIVLNSDNSCLVNNGWNDQASSLIVRTKTNTFSTTIQAENYSAMLGVQNEATTDAGGGQDVGYIDQGDWMAYNNITFPTSGTYTIQYRVASISGSRLSMDLNAGSIQLGTVNIPATGGWQNWTTVSQTVTVNAGTYNVGIYAQAGGWNINWFSITKNTGAKIGAADPQSEDISSNYNLGTGVTIYPNPIEGELQFVSGSDLSGGSAKVVNDMGIQVINTTIQADKIDVSSLSAGMYTLVVNKDGNSFTKRFIKK
ncbi:MAG TPA: carbohydrate-binding protein [Cytophagaceae bacterium]|jgi:beta-glucanase (GH16 family)|nr:carbohydrate-binding protein [Cytophagaceae bacterium]